MASPSCGRACAQVPEPSTWLSQCWPLSPITASRPHCGDGPGRATSKRKECVQSDKAGLRLSRRHDSARRADRDTAGTADGDSAERAAPKTRRNACRTSACMQSGCAVADPHLLPCAAGVTRDAGKRLCTPAPTRCSGHRRRLRRRTPKPDAGSGGDVRGSLCSGNGTSDAGCPQ